MVRRRLCPVMVNIEAEMIFGPGQLLSRDYETKPDICFPGTIERMTYAQSKEFPKMLA